MPASPGGRGVGGVVALYVIAGETFTSQTMLVERVRRIFTQAKLGIALVGQDRLFALHLLTRHPEFEEKYGCGVADIEVRENETWGKREFWIRRVDGTETDFSSRRCIAPGHPLRDFKMAVRQEILAQILEAKRKAFGTLTEIQCPVTGAKIGWKNCHVDHAAPVTFEYLTRTFFQSPEKVVVVGFGDGATTKTFADRDLADDWKAFHAETARLRVVSTTANLSVLRR